MLCASVRFLLYCTVTVINSLNVISMYDSCYVTLPLLSSLLILIMSESTLHLYLSIYQCTILAISHDIDVIGVSLAFIYQCMILAISHDIDVIRVSLAFIYQCTILDISHCYCDLPSRY